MPQVASWKTVQGSVGQNKKEMANSSKIIQKEFLEEAMTELHFESWVGVSQTGWAGCFPGRESSYAKAPMNEKAYV